MARSASASMLKRSRHIIRPPEWLTRLLLIGAGFQRSGGLMGRLERSSRRRRWWLELLSYLPCIVLMLCLYCPLVIAPHLAQ